VIAGHWRQKELFDGTYTFDDLVDIHEMMAVLDENRARSEDAARTRTANGMGA